MSSLYAVGDQLAQNSMAKFPDFFPDPDSPGSRFTPRPGIALLTRPFGESRFDHGDDTGDRDAVVEAAIGDSWDSAVPALGAPKAIDGAQGRGAAGWVPVIEWALEIVAAGVAWDLIKAAAREISGLIDGLHDRGVEIEISRGSAALVAIEFVNDQLESENSMDIEAVEEPSAIAGREVTELNYVGLEPWLVLLLDESRTTRYVAAVAPTGVVLGAMCIPMTEYEALFGT